MAIFTGHVGHVDQRHGVACFNPQHRTAHSLPQGFARMQHRQRAFQADTIDQHIMLQCMIVLIHAGLLHHNAP